MPQRPLYWLSLLFVFGFVSASFFLSVTKSAAFILLIIILGCLAGAALFRGWRKGSVCFLIWTLAFGYYAIYDSFHQTHLKSSIEPQIIEGVMVSSAKMNGDLMTFTFELRKLGDFTVNEKTVCQVPLKTRVEYDQAQLLRAGSILQFSSAILPVESPRNPGAFDYKRYLYYKGIHWMLKPASFSSISVQPPSPFHFRFLLDQFQRKLSASTDELFPPTSSSMIKGLLLGMRDDIPIEVTDTYSKLGLVHVLAISGLHMSVLVGGMLKLGEVAGLTRETRMVVTMSFIPGYIILVGAAPSVIRAGIMAVVVLLGHYLHRPRDGLNLLGGACLLMISFDPYQIWDIGFQLSFIVTWGLLVLTPSLTERLPALPPWFRSLSAVTLSAQLASLPVILFYFHQFHLLSPLVNLLFVPFFSFFIIPFGFLSLVLGFFHPSLSFLLAGFITSLLGWIYPILEWAAGLKSLQYYFSSPPLWWVLIYYAGLLLLPSILRGNKKSFFYFFLFIFSLCLPLLSFQEEKVVVTFLDVGQGDAIVIETPSGQVYLIDSGGAPVFYNQKDTWRLRKEPFDPGKKIIVPFLRAKGIEKIDTVFMTHGDSDHIGGMLSVLKEIKVGRLVGNGKGPSTPFESELISYMKDEHIPLYWGKRGDHWNNGPSVAWTILNPQDLSSKATNDNNQSIVIMLEAFGRRILFTGDLEKEGEQNLLSMDLPVPIDVLKVGHHGSKTSTQRKWIESLKPHLSIISVGKRNRFGHPHPDTILTLTEFGSRILRTDQVGSITLEIKKNSWNVFTSLQPNGEKYRLEK